MKTQEFYSLLAEKARIKKSRVIECIRAFEEILQENVLEEGDSVTIGKTGKFIQRVSKARTGRNPFTGKSIEIPSKKSVVFRPLAALRKK